MVALKPFEFATGIPQEVAHAVAYDGRIQWVGVPNASEYVIYRRLIFGDYDWQKIGSTTDLYFDDSEMRSSTEYVINAVVDGTEVPMRKPVRAFMSIDFERQSASTVAGATSLILANLPEEWSAKYDPNSRISRLARSVGEVIDASQRRWQEQLRNAFFLLPRDDYLYRAWLVGRYRDTYRLQGIDSGAVYNPLPSNFMRPDVLEQDANAQAFMGHVYPNVYTRITDPFRVLLRGSESVSVDIQVAGRYLLILANDTDELIAVLRLPGSGTLEITGIVPAVYSWIIGVWNGSQTEVWYLAPEFTEGYSHAHVYKKIPLGSSKIVGIESVPGYILGFENPTQYFSDAQIRFWKKQFRYYFIENEQVYVTNWESAYDVYTAGSNIVRATPAKEPVKIWTPTDETAQLFSIERFAEEDLGTFFFRFLYMSKNETPFAETELRKAITWTLSGYPDLSAASFDTATEKLSSAEKKLLENTVAYLWRRAVLNETTPTLPANSAELLGPRYDAEETDSMYCDIDNGVVSVNGVLIPVAAKWQYAVETIAGNKLILSQTPIEKEAIFVVTNVPAFFLGNPEELDNVVKVTLGTQNTEIYVSHKKATKLIIDGIDTLGNRYYEEIDIVPPTTIKRSVDFTDGSLAVYLSDGTDTWPAHIERDCLYFAYDAENNQVITSTHVEGVVVYPVAEASETFPNTDASMGYCAVDLRWLVGPSNITVAIDPLTDVYTPPIVKIETVYPDDTTGAQYTIDITSTGVEAMNAYPLPNQANASSVQLAIVPKAGGFKPVVETKTLAGETDVVLTHAPHPDEIAVYDSGGYLVPVTVTVDPNDPTLIHLSQGLTGDYTFVYWPLVKITASVVYPNGRDQNIMETVTNEAVMEFQLTVTGR